MLKQILTLSSIALLTGCLGNSIKNMDAFQKMPLLKAQVMPTQEELSGAPVKVVMFRPSDNASELANKSGAAGALLQTVEKYLGDANVEAVDRSLAKVLEQELELSESKTGANYQGPAIAQYAIKSAINVATYRTNYEPASSYKDDKGKIHRVPSKCSYEANVQGNLKIYKIPSLELVQSIALAGSNSAIRHKVPSSCPKSEQEIKGMVANAAVHSIKKIRTELQNVVAPVGYISEHRSHDGVDIYKITLGSKKGAKEGEKVRIFRQIKNTNDLTGKVSTETRLITEGVITDQVGPGYAWVKVSDKQDKIRLGHIAKIHYKAGFFSY